MSGNVILYKLFFVFSLKLNHVHSEGFFNNHPNIFFLFNWRHKNDLITKIKFFLEYQNILIFRYYSNEKFQNFILFFFFWDQANLNRCVMCFIVDEKLHQILFVQTNIYTSNQTEFIRFFVEFEQKNSEQVTYQMDKTKYIRLWMKFNHNILQNW